MIYSDRLRTFLHTLEGPAAEGEFPFDRLRLQAQENGVPVIRLEMERFLQVLLELKRPEHILEVGTAIGYSAMRMASFTSSDVKITTIENYEPRIEEAQRNFASCPWNERISLIRGDAAEVLGTLERSAYDFIFMDAAKAQYIHFLPDVLRVLKTGGLLISDNVLQDGMILESHYAVERRDRTIYRRMRDYLKVLCQTEGLTTSVVPIGDGAAVTIKEQDTVEIPVEGSLSQGE